MDRVLISILNYNSYQDTIEAIKCYLLQDHANIRIQVVDNASTDGSVGQIKKAFPDIDIVEAACNGGYAGGNNCALEAGLREDYDYIVVSNADIFIEQDFIGNMLQTAARYPVGVVGGVEVDHSTGKIKAAGGIGFNPWLSRGTWLPALPDKECDSYEVDYVQGSVIMFSKRALAAGVRFDDKLFMYLEEIDIGMQLKQKKLSARIDGRCRVHHKQKSSSFNLLAGYYIQRNRLYMARKYASFFVYVSHVLYVSLVELPAKVIFRLAKRQPQAALVFVRGYLDGLKGVMYMGEPFRCESK